MLGSQDHRRSQPLESRAARLPTRRRVPDAAILFSTVAAEYVDGRKIGRGCTRLRAESLKKTLTGIGAFENFVGDGYQSLHINQIDESILDGFVKSEHNRITTDSANAHLNVIGQILAFALRRHYITYDPAPKVRFRGSDRGGR